MLTRDIEMGSPVSSILNLGANATSVMTLGDIDQAIVLGDRARLYQLLLNLVSNAVKYTPEGGKVSIGLSKVNDWARLVVTDTGIGIPPEELPHVFERFYRVDKARSRSEGGTGLGLSIVKHVVERMRGRVTVESELGKGTCFTMILPACDSAAADAGQI